MRIVSSRVTRVGGTAASPVGIASAPHSQREGLVLVLTSDTGREGTGEASPLPGYSPDTIDDAAAALLLHPERAQRVEGLSDVAKVSSSITSPSARFAIETAMLDLLAQESGVPVHRLFRETSPAPIPRSALLPPPCDARTISAAQDAISRGIRTLKLKLGSRPFADELAALVALRAAIGDAIELRLDANGGMGEHAAERLRTLAAVRPAFVEEPLSGRALLRLLPGAVAVAADESLADPQIADALLAHPGLGAVVVKPALLGFFRAREIAVTAQRRGLPVVVTHLFDGPIALAACVELALSLPQTPAACGLDLHAALAAFPAREIPQLHDPASFAAAAGSGLCLSAAHQEAIAWRT